MSQVTYRVSDSLGSLLETYVLDGLADVDPDESDEARDLLAAYLAVRAGWDRKRDRLTVHDDQARVVAAGVIWALNSLGEEEPADGTGRIVANLHRSGEALVRGLTRQQKRRQP